MRSKKLPYYLYIKYIEKTNVYIGDILHNSFVSGLENDINICCLYFRQESPLQCLCSPNESVCYEFIGGIVYYIYILNNIPYVSRNKDELDSIYWYILVY